MYLLELFCVFFLCALTNCTGAINFRNNACKYIDLYPLWFLDYICYYNPDVLSDAPSMAARNNYSLETHYTTTQDGYILPVFRIHPKNIRGVPKKPPVFLQHGIATSSGSWFSIGDRSLVFNLADLGYEVWVGNFRGTTYSKKHVKYHYSDRKFWDFGVDELIYDLRSQLKLVSNLTGMGGKIIYIGHSMGTTSIFFYGSEYGAELKSLIQGVVALAPVAYLTKIPVAIYGGLVIDLLQKLGFYQFFANEDFVHQLLNGVCRFFPRICELVFFLLLGFGDQFKNDDLLLLVSYFPSGVSANQLEQYIKIARSDRLQKRDFGARKNLEVYKSRHVPVYNLTKFTMPVYMFYGTRDSLYNRENMDKLYNELGSPKKFMYRTPADGKDNFEHIDFLFSKNLKKYLYPSLFELMRTQFHN